MDHMMGRWDLKNKEKNMYLMKLWNQAEIIYHLFDFYKKFRQEMIDERFIFCLSSDNKYFSSLIIISTLVLGNSVPSLRSKNLIGKNVKYHLTAVMKLKL